jgi:hypothetical protein
VKYLAYRQGYEYEVKHWDGTGKCPFKIRDDWALPSADKETIGRIKESLSVEQDNPIDVNASQEVVDGCTRLTLLKELNKGVDYVVLEHLDDEIDSHTYALLKQLERRNVDGTTRKQLAAELARLLTQSKHRENVESGASEDPRSSNIPISQSREIVSDVAKQTSLSEKTVKKGIKEANEADTIIGTLPEKIKAHVRNKSNKITAKELAKIDANREQLQEVERALRVGQAEDIREAWQLIHGKTIGQMPAPKAKKDKAPAKPASKPAKPVSWRDKVRSLMKSIDAIVATVDEYRAERGETKSTGEVLEALDGTRKAMGKWRDSVR